MTMGYSESSVECAECARLIEQRRQLERVYLAALGKLTATYGTSKEYMTLRAQVDDAEIEMKLVGVEFVQHQDAHAPVN